MNTFEIMEYWAKGIAEDAELCEWLPGRSTAR